MMKQFFRITFWLPLVAVLAIFFIMKWWHTPNTTSDELRFLLAPVSQLVGWASGVRFTYLPEQGYFSDDLNIIINASCSGFNFWSLSFLMIGFVVFLRVRGLSMVKKIVSIPILLGLSFWLAVFTNAFRIIFSLFIKKIEPLVFGTRTPTWLHQLEGTFIYLSFLVISYLSIIYIIEKYNKKITSDETSFAS